MRIKPENKLIRRPLTRALAADAGWFDSYSLWGANDTSNRRICVGAWPNVSRPLGMRSTRKALWSTVFLNAHQTAADLAIY